MTSCNSCTTKDTGLSLIEVLVAMGLLGLALAMFGAAYTGILRTSEASTSLGAVTDQARLALHGLDRQVRSGYWVKAVSVPGASSAVQILTQNTDGSLECWVWALGSGTGSLLTFHYPEEGNQKWDPLASGKWHVAAGPEGGALTDVTFGANSKLSGYGEYFPLNPSDYSRPDLFQGAAVKLEILKGSSLPVTVEFTMTTRNQWQGAQYAKGCD